MVCHNDYELEFPWDLAGTGDVFCQTCRVIFILKILELNCLIHFHGCTINYILGQIAMFRILQRDKSERRCFTFIKHSIY